MNNIDISDKNKSDKSDKSNSDKFSKKAFGKFGEDTAAHYLTLRFYKILERNYRKRNAEVDIIAQKGKTLCFVEVKTRSNDKFGTPGEAVDFKKQQKIILGAQNYLAQTNWQGEVRFDVAEVYARKTKFGFKTHKINYIKNAFDNSD